MKLQKEVLGELCLVAGFSILSAANADAHTKQYSNNTEETARTESVVTAEKMPLRYFTPKQLAEGLAAAEVDDSTCNVFIEAYLAQLDNNGKITPKGLVTAMGEAGITRDQAQDMSKVLFAKDASKTKEAANGYDFGSYTVDFAIDKQGNLTKMNFQGDKKLSDKDIDEVHFARCRHKGLAYDDSQVRFESKLLLDKMLIRNIVLEKQNTPDAIVNGGAFLQNLGEELDRNGLEIGKDNRLHGIEASRDKPLLSNQDLYNLFVQQRMQDMKTI